MTKTLLDITIPGFELAAKQTKENVVCRSRKTGNVYMGRKTPESVRLNAKILAAALLKYRPRKPFTGPLELTLICAYGRKGARSSLRIMLRRLSGGKTTRPDGDNLAKQAQDVLEELEFFNNDAQIARLVVEKTELTGND